MKGLLFQFPGTKKNLQILSEPKKRMAEQRHQMLGNETLCLLRHFTSVVFHFQRFEFSFPLHVNAVIYKVKSQTTFYEAKVNDVEISQKYSIEVD